MPSPEFLKELQEKYPNATTIYLVVDNYPVHFHPNVRAALPEQIHDFKLHLPPSWSAVKPKAKFEQMQLNIQMIPLPTYASWLNPIEKLWKLLKKEVLNLHQLPNDFDKLVGKVEDWFGEFEIASHRLLQFCGLKNSKGIFAKDLIINQNKYPNLGPLIFE